jgi:hypothetical protein
VVIRNVANEEEIQASIDEIWQTLYDKSKELQDRLDALEKDTESREDILVHRDDPNRFLHARFEILTNLCLLFIVGRKDGLPWDIWA